MSKAAWIPRTNSPEDKRRELQGAVKEARENVLYWQRRAAIALNPDQKAHCLGLVSAWKTTAAAKEDRLQAAGHLAASFTP